MRETEVKVPIADSKYIYGILRGSYNEGPVVALCHGYGGWMDEMLMLHGARYLGSLGFSTLRLGMYGGGELSRDIAESDIMTHQADIDAVVRYLHSQGSPWVGVAGHSFSGLAILYSEEQAFGAAALWDPTHTDAYKAEVAINDLRDNYVYLEEPDIYVSGKGSGHVYARTVFDNDYPSSQDAAAKFMLPTIVINASWSDDQQEFGQKYVADISAESKHIVIPNSSHPFTEEGAAEKLFEETAQFFRSVING